MKKSILATWLFLFFIVATWNMANAVSVNYTDPYTQYLDAVSFFAVDKDDEGFGVNINVRDFSIVDGYNLEYFVGNGDWITLTTSKSTISILGEADHYNLVQMRLADYSGDEPVYYTSGTLEFSGQLKGGLNLYNSLLIDWGVGDITLTFNTVTSQDKLAAVPVPAAAILFGSGLLGLVGFGLRRQRKALAA
jgi:hypothetical protein